MFKNNKLFGNRLSPFSTSNTGQKGFMNLCTWFAHKSDLQKVLWNFNYSPSEVKWPWITSKLLPCWAEDFVSGSLTNLFCCQLNRITLKNLESPEWKWLLITKVQLSTTAPELLNLRPSTAGLHNQISSLSESLEHLHESTWSKTSSPAHKGCLSVLWSIVLLWPMLGRDFGSHCWAAGAAAGWSNCKHKQPAKFARTLKTSPCVWNENQRNYFCTSIWFRMSCLL